MNLLVILLMIIVAMFLVGILGVGAGPVVAVGLMGIPILATFKILNHPKIK